MKYRFSKPQTVAEILDTMDSKVPSTEVTIRRPAVDEEGNYVADMEIDFGKHVLSVQDERKLEELMNAQGLTHRRGQPNDE